MKLEQQIQRVILEEAKALIKDYHEYHNRVHLESVRNKKRLGDSAPDKKYTGQIIGHSIKNSILFTLNQIIKASLVQLQIRLKTEPTCQMSHSRRMFQNLMEESGRYPW